MMRKANGRHGLDVHEFPASVRVAAQCIDAFTVDGSSVIRNASPSIQAIPDMIDAIIDDNGVILRRDEDFQHGVRGTGVGADPLLTVLPARYFA